MEQERQIIYKKVEQRLVRPLSPRDYDIIENWFEKYDFDFIDTCVELSNHYPSVYSAGFIDKICYSNWVFYSKFKELHGKDKKEEVAQEEPIVKKETIVEDAPVDNESTQELIDLLNNL